MPEVKLGGHFKGGFAQGLNNARTQGRADRAQTLQQEQFDQKKAKQIYDEGVKNLQVMGERLSIMRAQNPDSEAVKQLEAAMQANGAQIEKLGMNLGLPGASGLGQSLMAMPDARQMATLEGEMGAASTGAQIDALSQIQGADRDAILRSQGLMAPKEAQRQPTAFDQKMALAESNPELAKQMGIIKEDEAAATRGDYVSPHSGRTFTDPGTDLTKGEETRDKTFVKEYEAFETKGGAQTVQKNLTQLSEALSYIRTQNVSGPIVGLADTEGSIVGKTVAAFNPQAENAKNLIAEVVQSNLRAVLGGQFAQKEGEQLIARAYNPKLPEGMNVARVERLMLFINEAFRAKQDKIDYFNQYGTIKGYKGKDIVIPSPESFYVGLDKEETSQGGDDDGWGFAD